MKSVEITITEETLFWKNFRENNVFTADEFAKQLTQCDNFNIFPHHFFAKISSNQRTKAKHYKKAFSKSLNSPISQFFAVL